MTDESVAYPRLVAEFDNHMTVNHRANEYAHLGSFVHINVSFFSILKRGNTGGYYPVTRRLVREPIYTVTLLSSISVTTTVQFLA